MRIARALLALALLSLSACTTIDTHRPPPDGWPALDERIEVVDYATLQRLCTLNLFCVATFWIRFDLGVCTIYVLTADSPFIPHERLHCRGYDHPGSTVMADGFARWQEHGRLSR